jgi:small GTP-binding protein
MSVNKKKLAIIGLDNAGKTSILTLMKKKFDVTNEIRGLKPTLKVDRSSLTFLSQEISSWDFGGQKSYREEYLAHKDRYLEGVDLIFFVIDSQDALRFDEALEYFKGIVEYYSQIKVKIPICVIFHKMDLKISEDPALIANIEALKTRFQPYIEDYKIQFFTTTIQQLQTVVHAFSVGISKLFTQTEAITQFLLDLVNKLKNVMALLLFEQSGISLGEYYLEHITLTMKQKILTLYEIAQKRIMQRNINTYEFSDRLDAFTKVSGLIQSFEIEGQRFFILLVVEEHDEEEVINEFNFFEQSYTGIHEVLKTLLEDDPEKQKKLGLI